MYAAPSASRYGSAAIAVGLTAAMGWALLVGLAGGTIAGAVPEALKTFVVPPPPPPPPEKRIERPHVSKRAEGRAAPPNIRSKATPVVAPTPVVPLKIPPPIVAAPKPFQGNQATQGAAPIAGPGTGAGGEGDGTGSGGWGNGDGDGGTPPRWKKGRIKDSDFPHDAAESGLHGAVSVRFMVWTDGRVRDCTVTRSSGSAVLDATTCRLITERMRYDPGRDEDGRPVPTWLLETHTWINDGPPPAD